MMFLFGFFKQKVLKVFVMLACTWLWAEVAFIVGGARFYMPLILKHCVHVGACVSARKYTLATGHQLQFPLFTPKNWNVLLCVKVPG